MATYKSIVLADPVFNSEDPFSDDFYTPVTQESYIQQAIFCCILYFLFIFVFPFNMFFAYYSFKFMEQDDENKKIKKCMKILIIASMFAASITLLMLASFGIYALVIYL